MKLIKLLLYYFLALLSIFFVGRVVLFSLYFERFADSDVNYWLTFLYGLKMDVIVVCGSLLLPVILLTLAPKQVKNTVNRFLTAYFIVVYAR
ncbi:MAG: LTA synthase family protein, partial [gamma proteobacterium symbiont of Lucinoma myriamae]|nr:LTA synthase family protein [gamma proteobacterium symbiont of Lucinoma myriamae]